MWSKVAEEMAVPWRAAEAMHWQLGETDMARRAGVVPFSLSNATLDAQPSGPLSSPSSRHSHSQSHSRTLSSSSGQSSSRFGRVTTVHRGAGNGNGSGGGSARMIAARKDSTPRSVPPASLSDGLALSAIGGGIAMGMGRGTQMLPSVAEMTTGVSPYSTPAYAVSTPTAGGYSSPGLLLPAIGFTGTRPDVKRRASPEVGPRETSRRRQ